MPRAKWNGAFCADIRKPFPATQPIPRRKASP